MKIKCKYIKLNDSFSNLEIELIKPKPKVWIGMDNMLKSIESTPGAKTAYVKRVIRHGHSYKGGGSYGHYGGYDIALMELVEQIHTQLACLPVTLQDTDIDAEIAGYGQDKRRNCQTNEFGYYKHHYCKKHSKCINNKAPPQHKLCDIFFSNVHNWSDGGKHDEAMIISRSQPIFCHQTTNPENSLYGWCNTGDRDFYQFREKRMSQDGWGYCSKDCYLDDSYSAMGQILRHENVHVSFIFSLNKSSILYNVVLGFG